MSFKLGDLVRICYCFPNGNKKHNYLHDSIGVLVFKEIEDPLHSAWQVNCEGRNFLIYEGEMLKLQLFNSMHGTQEEEA